jgi:hypothetical protein
VAVLVDVVELAEKRERFVPTHVRLERADHVFRARRDSLYFSREFGFLFGRSLETREIEAAPVSNQIAVGVDQLVDEVIEGAPQVVNRLSDDHSNHGGDLLANLEPKDIRLRVLIAHDTIRVGFAKGLDSPFEVRDVLFGPFDF